MIKDPLSHPCYLDKCQVCVAHNVNFNFFFFLNVLFKIPQMPKSFLPLKKCMVSYFVHIFYVNRTWLCICTHSHEYLYATSCGLMCHLKRWDVFSIHVLGCFAYSRIGLVGSWLLLSINNDLWLELSTAHLGIRDLKVWATFSMPCCVM